MIHERIEPSKEQKKEIINKIQKYKEMGADCIIMCMHEGGQYNKKPIQRAKKTVKFLMKNGIDLIIGNHEHVIQCAKIERKKLISFSLGNFVGAAGVLKEPFDKMAEYSILVNVYISKENQNIHFDKYTFTVLKTIKEKTNKGNTLKVCLLYDVIKKCNDENEKKRLLIDNQKIIQIVTGKQIDINDVQLEYEIK